MTGSDIAAVQPTTSSVAVQHSLPTVASPSSPVGALTGSMSLPLSRPSHGALRRPYSAPIGSRILPSVPENSVGAMDAPDLAEAAAHEASLSLMGGSSIHTSEVVGSEASSASGQDFLPWRLPAGTIRCTLFRLHHAVFALQYLALYTHRSLVCSKPSHGMGNRCQAVASSNSFNANW